MRGVSAAAAGGDDGVAIAPIRSLEDFLLGQLPDMNNEERWFNRIVNNLLYYQTNYFMSSLLLFGIVAFAKPDQMACGVGTMMILFGLMLFLQKQKAEFETFKKKYPLVVVLAIFLLGYYIVYQLGYIVVFLLGVILPIVFVIAHASLRLRNVRNKLANATEALGLAKKTPMGIILEEMGIETNIKIL